MMNAGMMMRGPFGFMPAPAAIRTAKAAPAAVEPMVGKYTESQFEAILDHEINKAIERGVEQGFATANARAATAQAESEQAEVKAGFKAALAKMNGTTATAAAGAAGSSGQSDPQAEIQAGFKAALEKMKAGR